jgi:hypothetical protein
VVSEGFRGRQLSADPLGSAATCDTRMWAKPGSRSGLRVCGGRGHPVVRRALLRYATWLRANHAFPVRVPVYLLPGDTVITMHGDAGSASFFAPWSPREEPYIRIATGDYPRRRRESGRDNALAGFICSLSHEVIHYQQWLSTGEVWERGVAVAATAMLRRYETTTPRP